MTAGRVLFAAVQWWIPSRAAYHGLPILLAAFGVGPLTSAGIALPQIFAAAAFVAVLMGGLSLLIAHRRPSPPSLHPRPAAPRPRARTSSTTLYVVDSSFMPSIGAVNPALTVMANAIRVGEHLLQRTA